MEIIMENDGTRKEEYLYVNISELQQTDASNRGEKDFEGFLNEHSEGIEKKEEIHWIGLVLLGIGVLLILVGVIGLGRYRLKS